MRVIPSYDNPFFLVLANANNTGLPRALSEAVRYSHPPQKCNGPFPVHIFRFIFILHADAGAEVGVTAGTLT